MKLFQSKDKYQVVLKPVITGFFLSIVLASCSTKPSKPKENVSQVVSKVEQTVKEIPASAAQYLADARAKQPNLALPLMVSAAQQYLIEKNYLSALWLAHQTQAVSIDTQQQYDLILVQASALQQLNYAQRAFEQLQSADALLQQATLNHSLDYYQLLSTVEQERQHQVASLAAQLSAFTLNDQAGSDQIFSLWQQLTQLSQWQLTQLKQMAPPFIQGWQQLLSFAHQFGANNAQFGRYLSQWQRNYPNHPGNALLDSLVNTSPVKEAEINNIAVILPLSGRQQAAGNAMQQGILSAYRNDESKTLHFIDAEQLDMSGLQQTLVELAIDAVIGPLLKANVKKYLTQEALNIPTLLLNVPDNVQLKAHQVALSMRPEDEAVQAATQLSRFAYKYPIVLSYQDKVSLRIAKAFAAQWQISTGNSIEIVPFEQGPKMKNNLQQSLEVTNSQRRISSLKRRIKQTLETETRNRRDIDMIYLVGNTQQTRLLKPYIDVNISQFAKVIPVYASSRSHSAKSDGGALRDLNGLTFTAMPWLLTSKQQNQQLAQLSHKLWPKRSDSLQSIFAMGFDSLTLIEKISLMQKNAYVRHFGQTGVLKLNPNNILTRSLLWGRYQNNQVRQISLQ